MKRPKIVNVPHFVLFIVLHTDNLFLNYNSSIYLILDVS